MKSTTQKIKEQITGSITKGCIAAICVYTPEEHNFSLSQSTVIQTENFSDYKDNTIRKEMVLQMMEDDKALWI